jgi:peptide/nickel transport system substrate-binding protein
MVSAGFRKGPDGIYASPVEGRFAAEIKTNGAQDNEAEMSILASGWRASGFDVQDSVLSAALARNNEVRASFQSMFASNTGAGQAALFNQTSAKIPSEDNRWQGGNRGGWSNADFDRLAQSFATTLERNERTRLLVETGKLYTEQLPAIPLFYRTIPWAFVSGLRGVRAAPPEGNVSWNIHEWTFE